MGIRWGVDLELVPGWPLRCELVAIKLQEASHEVK